MIDGAAWLELLRQHPGKLVALSHEQALSVASSLAVAQAACVVAAPRLRRAGTARASRRQATA